ncbi:MAG TPA: lipopolysaccharide biosynthesis protein [Candidatus Aminicenantes bacterium]|nr:lipopolysaccharide biosynthesis protein [Candidatus Aminicenantes bacterium]HRY64885.1 lipopolysaccharide biosynthesis protein [Candidatus Aminicenantes bacterium]HRZ71798.1 lipopolysaccharide biosynthesis protein [Candidatus Aminicenantes bacterium]
MENPQPSGNKRRPAVRPYSFATGHLDKDIKRKAVRGSAATILSQLLSFIFQAGGTMVLARMLTPSDFGLVAMVTTFSLVFQNFGLSGFTEAIIHAADLDQDRINVLFWINVALCAAITVFFAGLSPALAWFYREPRLVGITAAISLSIIASGFSTFPLALLKRNMQFGRSSSILAWAKLASVVLTIVLAWGGAGYWALVFNVVSLPLITAVLAWLSCSWRPSGPAFRGADRSLTRYALHTYGNFVLHYGSRNMDNLLVGKVLGVQPLGFYKKAHDLFALPMSQLISPLANVALAALGRYKEDRDKLLRYFFDALSTIAFISMGLSLVLTVAAEDIILLLLGPAWGRTAEVFLYFGPGIGFMLVYGTHGWLHLSLGRADRWLRWGIFEFVVTAALIAVGINFGLNMVALAWTGSFVILAGPGIWYAGRPVGLKFGTFYAQIWRYALAALGAGVACRLVLFSGGAAAAAFARLSIFLRIPVSFVACLALYAGLVAALFGNLRPFTKVIDLGRAMLSRGAAPER